jgi:nucleosome binding factor SPN SPT16 subunit
VLMAPATDALVQLTEPPFTVITLDDVEVAHLERIQVCPSLHSRSMCTNSR